MEVNKTGYAYYAAVAAQGGPSPGGAVKAAKEAEAAVPEKETAGETAFVDAEHSTDVVQITGAEEDDGRESLQELMARLEESKNAFKIKASVPSDSSGRLAERLVAATDQFEVRMVMTEANRALTSLQNAAVFVESKDKARVEAMIRKIKKLLDQGGRKIQGLGEEEALRTRQVKAKQAKQELRAQQLKEELRRKKADRERKEQAYLQEARKPLREGTDYTQNQTVPPMKGEKLDAVSEAQIAAEAEAMAAAEFAAGGGEAALGADVAMAGGEAGSTEAAAAPAGVDAAAGGDVAVSAGE